MELDVSLHDAIFIQVLSQDLVALASGSVIYIYDMKNRVLFKTLYYSYNQGMIYDWQFLPNESVLAIASQNILVIDPKTGKRDGNCMSVPGSECGYFYF